MNKMKLILTGSFLIYLIISAYNINAQNIYISNVSKSDLVVNGTSSLHNWHMKSENFECSVKAINEKNKIVIEDVNFSCNSTSLKSESSLMDKKAWDALKANNFKTILFKSLKTTELNLKNNKIEGNLDGDLIMTGEKKRISLPFEGEIDEDGNLKLWGDVKVKMSDFGIEPPTALMGSIRTGDEINIEFNLSFNPPKIISSN
jgi:polyisoprenoid-binding protein YceI